MSEIKANNININYQLKGEGKTIVFVHGLSDNLHYWDILTNELASRYQVLTYDLRGHGSSGDDDRQSSIDLYQEDLYCLLNELNIDNAVFIGLSLGGNVILDLVLNHPEKVNGMIIMSSFPELDERLRGIFKDFENGINQGFVEFFDIILPYTLTEDMIEENKEVLESLKYEAAKVANIEGIKNGIKAGYGFNVTDRLNEIDVPTVVIAGEEDDLTDLNIQKKIQENIKGSELIVLEKTKHNLLIGRNISRIIEIIDEFMLKIE